MSDTPTPSPTPPQRTRRGAPAPLPPTPPGPVAGNPIGPVKRDLPPGIPAHISERTLQQPRNGIGAREQAPEVPLHPTFAGPNLLARQRRQQAEALRAQAQSTALSLRTQTTALTAQIEAISGTPEGLLAASVEGLDLELLKGFTACLEHAIQFTEPPTKS